MLMHCAAGRMVEALACFQQACANERARGAMRQLALQYLVQLTLLAIPYHADDTEPLEETRTGGGGSVARG